jgi:thiosulfate/3-mercaptopyruvate sulfurtransferase
MNGAVLVHLHTALIFAPRKGRLPGACWVEWYDFMDSNQEIPHFKSPDEIRAICAKVGLYIRDGII